MIEHPHHWLLGETVEGPPDKHPERGMLRYRASRCQECGEERIFKERETNYISRYETETL